jgi:fumarate reductase flavoprotein subunit
VDAGRAVRGVEITRPDGTRDSLGCDALILACNGYGGAPDLVAKHIPEMRHASYFGHPGNRGDAVLWGERLRAKLEHMSGYQGHGSVAHPHGILISWAVIMEGGFQVNKNGARFSDESLGYSEQAAVVLAQPDGSPLMSLTSALRRSRGNSQTSVKRRRRARSSKRRRSGFSPRA